MGTRDVIAMPATIAFVVFGFYGIVAHRLETWRRRARDEGPRTTPSKWGQLSPATKFRRCAIGVILGAVAAMLLLVVVEHIIHVLSL